MSQTQVKAKQCKDGGQDRMQEPKAQLNPRSYTFIYKGTLGIRKIGNLMEPQHSN